MSIKYLLLCSGVTFLVGCKIVHGNDKSDSTFNSLENIYDNYKWVEKINDSHPRLFFNNETFNNVKKRAINEEKHLFTAIKEKVDKLLDEQIIIKNPLIEDGQRSDDHYLGSKAAEAAFVFLINKDLKYYDLSIRLLQKAVEYYQIRNKNGLCVSWYSYSRIHALLAYDWLYNYMPDRDRTEIGTKLFKEIAFMLPAEDRKKFYRENREGINGGFYNNQNLEWYLGLTFFNTGIDDPAALDILKTGYDSHVKVLKYRETAAGDDGGAASGCLPYVLTDYPWAEFNFFHTFISATGGYNITAQWDYLSNFPNYVYWNILPGIREFGYGDAHHTTNLANYSILNMHFSQVIHFYSDRFPREATLAKWMMSEWYPRKNGIESDNFPLIRFFLNSIEETSVATIDPEDELPTARYFEKMGQIFMRSGSGSHDTYATFTVSSALSQHKHYDNNNFNIYKKGFLTLDTGTRPWPGLHLSHYYPRTVAHNCVTIRMPGEVLPNYWNYGPAPGEASQPIPNDGGQNSLEGTKVVSFDEKKEYVYIASDATGSYSSIKANLVLRQFVFLPPNNFVVFDRVSSTNKDYPKRWLLHTAEQPVVTGNEFHHSFEDGTLVCKTIYPEEPVLELMGGPGKQFWSDGNNWPLYNGNDEKFPLYGQWRVEVKPSTPVKDDLFLHVIQVGDRADNITSIPSAKKIEEGDRKGVQFKYNEKEYKILFNTSGTDGGKITVITNGRLSIDEEFTDSIKPQSGLSLN